MCVVGDLSEDGNISHMFSSQMRGPTMCHFGRRALSFHDREKCGPWRSRHDFKLYLKNYVTYSYLLYIVVMTHAPITCKRMESKSTTNIYGKYCLARSGLGAA